MIKKDDIFQIGKLIKPHGLQGELSFEFTTDVFDECEVPYLICEIDGLFIPFYIESFRFRGENSGLIKFENINNEEEAKELSKINVYMMRNQLPDNIDLEELEGYDYYIGYNILDVSGKKIGEITAIDDSTENILFCIESANSGEEILIPLSDDFIEEINDNNKTITMNLPEGLLDLDSAPTL